MHMRVSVPASDAIVQSLAAGILTVALCCCHWSEQYLLVPQKMFRAESVSFVVLLDRNGTCLRQHLQPALFVTT